MQRSPVFSFLLSSGLTLGLTLPIFALAPLSALTTSASAEEEGGSILLATTTSTENSGLLDYLNPVFERETGIRVRVLPRGTGAALRAGRDGNCDVLLVHDRRRELEFIREGYGTYHHPVMHNDFVVVGPPEDPAGIRGMRDAALALTRVAASSSRFVSRGDDSGTHAREKELWESAGFTIGEEGIPRSPTVPPPSSRSSSAPRWYLSVGQGMAKTLTIAYEKRGYALTDRGTFLSQQERMDLEILVEGDRRLHNPYGIMAVNPARHPHVEYELARRYVDWITSPRAQQLIAGFTFKGEPLFYPDAPRADAGRAPGEAPLDTAQEEASSADEQ